MSLSSTVLLGRLTADPELRKTSNDISVCSFTVATDKPHKTGEQAKSNFIDCVAWRASADFITKYFHKGDLIAVRGELSTDNYEDKSGNKRKKTEVIVDTVSFAGKTGKGESKGNAAETGDTDAQGEFEEVGTDDDLPF